MTAVSKGTAMRPSPRVSRAVLALSCAALLGACASRPAERRDAPVYGGSGPSGSQSVAYGTVRGIESIGIDRDQPHGAGAVVGGVIGGLIGRQMADSNSGRNVGTAVGALGGAIIGHEIEKNARRDPPGVRITVTLDDGSLRRFEFKDSGGLRVGDRVRVEGRQLYRIG
jgi:outer membrane lipoprotein SlyB